MTDLVREPSDPFTLLAEIAAGEGINLAAAGRLFPGHRGGPAVDPSTVFRWVKKGRTAGDGSSSSKRSAPAPGG